MNAQTSLRREPPQDEAIPRPAPASPAYDLRGAEIVDLRERRAAIRRRKDPVERRAPVDAPLAVIRRTAPAASRSAPDIRSAWVLEFEPSRPKPLDPLMGWTGSRDTQGQVRLTFPTLEAARRFADERGWRHTVRKPRRRRPVIKSYADRFAWDRRAP